MPISLQIALNLSSNFFNGSIPDTLNGLPALEVLDLSNNGFIGEIPNFLTTLASLTCLLLSNNHLSGTLPKFRQPFIHVNTDGNNITTPTPTLPKKRRSAAVTVVVAVVAVAVPAIGVIIMISHFYRVKGHLITANTIHRFCIDFDRAMKAVGNPANVMLKTKFSTCYKANMPGGRTYYVKKLNWSDKMFHLGSHERFGQELEVLGKLSHSNIMTPLAYVLTANSAHLFYTYAQKGTLFDVLHGTPRNALDWTSRYSIAIRVAQGLAFLHGCTSRPVILFDLSTKSILLKSLKEPRIGDIEICRVIDPSKRTGSISAIAGSVGYIPPEYAYTMRVTMSGNVYSFGVVLLELLTGKPAVSEGTELAKWVLSNSVQRDSWDHILDSSVCNTSLEVRSQMLSVLETAISCVSVSPEARPETETLLKMLLNAR
ncbi:hypothetical protein HHK36_007857 [Tetracentron sinense]|uniref:non-specific serine/threonine protein kinase n=1 Tax=Tetracentron sinense TaxID=13715 RepID=A0A834ZEK4_TETSI|nr:hypothetical protein HHK36_007857 [Tetracentron sinense]